MLKSVWTILYKSEDEFKSTVALDEKSMIEKRKELNNSKKTIIDVFLSEFDPCEDQDKDYCE